MTIETKSNNQNLLDEIQESISKNLPSQVAGELKVYLEKAQNNEIELKEIKESYKLLKETYEAQNKKLYEYDRNLEAMQSQTERLNKVERELEKRELKLDNTLLQIRLEESDKRASEAVNFVGMVFKSPVYRKSLTENVFNNQMYDNNGHSYNVNNGGMKTETTEQE
jgi:hypothetical protein